MNAPIPLSIICTACQIGGGAVDYSCIDCCVRLLGRLPSREAVAGHLRSMERFNSATPGFAEELAAAWKAHVEQRRKGK